MNNKLKKIASWSALPSLVLFVLFFIIYVSITGTFSASLLRSFIATNAGAICVAIGVAATIIIGGTDISLGAIVSLTNVVMVTLVGKGQSVWVAALLALLSAVIAGAINGFIVGVIRVNPLLTTFATATVFSGVALWLLPYPGGSIDFAYSDWFNSNVLGVIPIPLIMIGIPLATWLIWNKTPFGIKIYGIGKNPKKAYATGINVMATRFFVHTFAGFAAGIAGLCISASICAGNPTVGATMSMTSIAAAVIGGVSLNGGIGNVWGAVFGAMFLSILVSLVVSANMSSFVQSFVQGIILLMGVVCTVIASDKEIISKITGVFKKGEKA
ncbi:MAG: ABC transporter permease [Lachnospiraceae bacterium]|nr:ABC transporter permease [Lachnospiraceae bacterium]